MKNDNKDVNTNRPLNGQEYLSSLRDGRTVYFAGKEVPDLTSHVAAKNAAASVAKLYDALHDSKLKNELCWQTDTGNNGYTHKYFRYAKSANDLREQRDAIAAWARISYGWLARTPDYKAAFSSPLGFDPDFYGKYSVNARAWYKKIQESCLYLNHAILDPPGSRIDGMQSRGLKIDRETDSGIYVTGSKSIATNAALTHYIFVNHSDPNLNEDDSDATSGFIVPVNAKGVKIIMRQSYEYIASQAGSVFDYPLSSRFDENDAILIFDQAFIPWENVLIYRNAEACRNWFGQGFGRIFPLQACTRMAVKMDFMVGLLSQTLESIGRGDRHGIKAKLGEIIAWRNTFWSLTSAMWSEPEMWKSGAAIPNSQAAEAFRVLAPTAYSSVRQQLQAMLAGGLIYLPASAQDLADPIVGGYLKKYLSGQNGISHIQRVKLFKLLWDAVGSEFAGRHELYETNWAGSADTVRLICLANAKRTGDLEKTSAFVDRCLSEYNENGLLK